MVTGLQDLSAQVIEHTTHVEVQEDGRKITTRTVLLQINDKQQNWMAQVALNHNPKQDFKLAFAQLEDASGEIVRKLKKKDLVTRNDISYQAFHQDDLITEFSLYHNQYPYRIRYAYTLEETEYLFIAQWSPVHYYDTPTLKARLEVSLPPGYPIQWTLPDKGIETTGELGVDTRLSFEGAYLQKIEEEVLGPSRESQVPWVKLIPANFKYGRIGNQSSWRDFGLWVEAINAGAFDLPKGESWNIQQMVQHIDNPKDKVRKIYHYLQDHTSYVNVALDVGGLKSYPASYVMEKKYGDCKALTTYMKAMLNSVDIPSTYTIIKAGKDETGIDVKVPGQHFNHVVLMVPLEQDTLWLENTSNILPFNYLGTFTQDRYALGVNKAESGLVQTPKLSREDVLIKRRYTYDFSERDRTEIVTNLKLRGEAFEEFLQVQQLKDRDKELELLGKLIHVRNLRVGEFVVENHHRDSTEIEVLVKAFAPGIVRKIGNTRAIQPLRIAIPDFEKPAKRTLDVILNYPVYRQDVSRFDLEPMEYDAVQIPEGFKLESEFGTYSSEAQLTGKKVEVNESFLLYSQQIPLEKYPEFYAFITAIESHKKRNAILIK